MNDQPSDTVVLLRRGRSTAPGLFERVMAMACQEIWWFAVDWREPDPDIPKRESVYHRDVEMVRDADLVLAFFDSGEMNGGTGHVVEKAQDQGVPVYAWGLVGGTFVRIGEHDPGNAWGASMMKP